MLIFIFVDFRFERLEYFDIYGSNINKGFLYIFLKLIEQYSHDMKFFDIGKIDLIDLDYEIIRSIISNTNLKRLFLTKTKLKTK